MLDVCPVLQPERRGLLRLLRDLSEDQWHAPTECPAWTVKGIALHLLGDDLSLLSRQRDAATNGLLLYAENHPGLSFPELLDGFNQQWVRAAGFLSTPIVIDLLELSGAWTEAFYRSVDPSEPGEPVGFFGSRAEPSPWWQVAAREYAERWIHHSQIRRALDLPPVDDDIAEPARSAVVLGTGARNVDLGQFSIGDRTWTFRDGAHLALDPAVADLVLSRGLAFDDTIAALTGEPSVVRTVAQQTCRDLRPG